MLYRSRAVCLLRRRRRHLRRDAAKVMSRRLALVGWVSSTFPPSLPFSSPLRSFVSMNNLPALLLPNCLIYLRPPEVERFGRGHARAHYRIKFLFGFLSTDCFVCMNWNSLQDGFYLTSINLVFMGLPLIIRWLVKI